MTGNQLATVIMRVWQVFHIIDGNLRKSENNQNRKDSQDKTTEIQPSQLKILQHEVAGGFLGSQTRDHREFPRAEMIWNT